MNRRAFLRAIPVATLLAACTPMLSARAVSAAPGPLVLRIGGLSELNAFLQQVPMKVERNILRGALRAEFRRLLPSEVLRQWRVARCQIEWRLHKCLP